jgi:hypothetical protein
VEGHRRYLEHGRVNPASALSAGSQAAGIVGFRPVAVTQVDFAGYICDVNSFTRPGTKTGYGHPSNPRQLQTRAGPRSHSWVTRLTYVSEQS